ncbi:uncharacterized protein LOC111692982 [Anoplophora glabripennis]|uniref:uncharacterized protein LOC111692982 n=1 Tax=Anoplophora glabripennis TaxID=217634 RepID=UPI000C785238|nr:uncharacterized protein LOC111692982 [Anoplophora glabripennis]
MPSSSTPVRSPRDSTSFGQEGFTPSLTLQDGSEGFTPSVISARSIEQENAPSPNINNSILVVHEPGLDEEVLKCLGEDPENAKTEKVELHKALSPRWQHMLTKGISKDNKLELLAKYPVPSNCGGLQTPTLNPEIAQAVSDISLKKYKSSPQNQPILCPLFSENNIFMPNYSMSLTLSASIFHVLKRQLVL